MGNWDCGSYRSYQEGYAVPILLQFVMSLLYLYHIEMIHQYCCYLESIVGIKIIHIPFGNQFLTYKGMYYM